MERREEREEGRKEKRNRVENQENRKKEPRGKEERKEGYEFDGGGWSEALKELFYLPSSPSASEYGNVIGWSRRHVGYCGIENHNNVLWAVVGG